MAEEKLFMPSYGRHFECIAGDCPENCCVEWIVDIDENSKKFYETAEGAVGENIRSHMVHEDEDDETVFSLTKGMNHVREWGIEKDDQGKSKLKLSGESADEISSSMNNDAAAQAGSETCDSTFDMNCPFQRDDGLCEIRLTYGYEHTSETCREHPEFNEEYEDFTERSFSISCPEIARLISETPLKKDIDEDDEILLTPLVYPSAPCQSSDAVLNALARARNKLFFNFDEDELLGTHIIHLRDAAFSLQPKLFQMDEAFAEALPSENNMLLDSFFRTGDTLDETDAVFCDGAAGLIKYMIENQDFLTKRWENALNTTLSFLQDGQFSVSSFAEFCRTKTQDISRVFAYFAYRYFLKAVNDCNIVKWSEFVIKCILVSVLVSFATGMDFYRTAALFSREVEHDGDNASMLLDMIFDE